jgi:hypothetical protein
VADATGTFGIDKGFPAQIDVSLLATLSIREELRPFIAAGRFVSFLLDAIVNVELVGASGKAR